MQNEKKHYFIPRSKREKFEAKLNENNARFVDVSNEINLTKFVKDFGNYTNYDLVSNKILNYREIGLISKEEYKDAWQKLYEIEAEKIKKDYLIVEIYADQSWDNFELYGAAKIEPDGTNYFTFVESDLFTFKNKNVDFSHCDHCNKRINRKSSYFVYEKGSNSVIQLGGTCAANLDIETKIAKLAERILNCVLDIASSGDDFYGAGKRSPYFSPINSLIVGMISDRGYISTTKAREQMIMSTSDMIQDLIFEVDEKEKHTAIKEFKRLIEIGSSIIGENEKITDEMIEYWSKRLSESQDDFEFCNNILNAVTTPTIKKHGMYTFAVYDYMKRNGILSSGKEPIKPLDLPAGKTQDIPGSWEVISKENYENDFGIQTFIKCLNENREGVQFYTKPSNAYDIEIGQKIKLRAGIKGLNKNKTMLVLTRVQIKV